MVAIFYAGIRQGIEKRICQCKSTGTALPAYIDVAWIDRCLSFLYFYCWQCGNGDAYRLWICIDHLSYRYQPDDGFIGISRRDQTDQTTCPVLITGYGPGVSYPHFVEH